MEKACNINFVWSQNMFFAIT